MYVCMCVCMYVYLRLCPYVRMYVCMHISICTGTKHKLLEGCFFGVRIRSCRRSCRIFPCMCCSIIAIFPCIVPSRLCAIRLFAANV